MSRQLSMYCFVLKKTSAINPFFNKTTSGCGFITSIFRSYAASPVSCQEIAGYHYNDVIMGAIASEITSLAIVYSIVYSDANQKNIKAPRHWPLCGEFTGDRWIPRTNGQLRGKCFHLMTSSWYTTYTKGTIEINLNPYDCDHNIYTEVYKLVALALTVCDIYQVISYLIKAERRVSKLTIPSLVEIIACHLGRHQKHYLNQCWNIVNWTLGKKLQWNLNRNLYIFIQENAFENV